MTYDVDLLYPSDGDRSSVDFHTAPQVHYHFGFGRIQVFFIRSGRTYYVVSRGFQPHSWLHTFYRNGYLAYKGLDFDCAKIRFRNLVMEILHNEPAVPMVLSDGLSQLFTDQAAPPY